MKIWCLYVHADYEGCSNPEHFFDLDSLLERLSRGLYGANDIYVLEINTKSKTVSTIFKAIDASFEYRIEDTKQLQADVKAAVNRVIS